MASPKRGAFVFAWSLHSQVSSLALRGTWGTRRRSLGVWDIKAEHKAPLEEVERYSQKRKRRGALLFRLSVFVGGAFVFSIITTLILISGVHDVDAERVVRSFSSAGIYFGLFAWGVTNLFPDRWLTPRGIWRIAGALYGGLLILVVAAKILR